MLVIVAPGQGAQSPGFLTPWLEVDGAADRLAWWSAITGLDLIRFGTKGTADEIRDTAVAQPLLVAAGLVAAHALFPQPSEAWPVGAVAGHSVGEITAAVGAGVLSIETAMAFVRQRGLAMAMAAAVTETGMVTVLGGDPDEVAAKLAEHGLVAANHNGGGQVVAAGTLEQLAALGDDPPAGAQLVPLAVAGAFHTHHMAPSREVLAKLAPSITARDPRVPYVSNQDGQVVTSGAMVLNRLVSQVSQPVRWDLCMETLVALGVTCLIEMPPAGTLANLAKRNLKGLDVLALKTPDDLDKARELLAEHRKAAPQKAETMFDRVRADAARVLGFEVERVDPDLGFFEMGMDSMMAVEFRRRLEASLDRKLATTVLFDHSSVTALTAYLVGATVSAPNLPDTEDDLLRLLREETQAARAARRST